jgi:hypothetical protein
VPPILRPHLAALIAAAVGVTAAVILGEYELTGATPWLSGTVVGFLIGEVMLAVARRRTLLLAAVAAGVAGGSLLWAGWISSGEGVAPYPAMAWVAAALAAAVAGWRTRPTAQNEMKVRRRHGSPP